MRTRTITADNELRMYSDDTYLIISAINVNSSEAELDDIEASARANNLTLNPSKITEIIFDDIRRSTSVSTTVADPGSGASNINQ